MENQSTTAIRSPAHSRSASISQSSPPTRPASISHSAPISRAATAPKPAAVSRPPTIAEPPTTSQSPSIAESAPSSRPPSISKSIHSSAAVSRPATIAELPASTRPPMIAKPAIMLREPVILKPDVAPEFISSNGQIARYKPCTVPLPRRPWYEIVGLILLCILWPFAAMYIDGASPTTVHSNLLLWLFIPIPAIGWGILYILRSKEHRDVSNPMRRTLWTPAKHTKALDKLKKKPSKSAKGKPRETKTDGLQKGVTLPQERETPAKAEVDPPEKADPSPSELEAGPSKEPPKQEKEIKSKKVLV